MRRRRRLSKATEDERSTLAVLGDTPGKLDGTRGGRRFGRRKVSATSLLLLLFAVGAAATGQVLLKHGMSLATASATKSNSSLVVKAATSPWILLGLAVFAISAVAWLGTLSRLPLSIAYPFNALGYLAILTASTVVLNERTNVWTWIGTACVVGGLVIVVLTQP
jgi:drug/metabolite transporter (DMT)-like permease